jgi:hypothetical protein
MILLIHTLAGIVALIAGAINLLRTKGTLRSFYVQQGSEKTQNLTTAVTEKDLPRDWFTGNDDYGEETMEITLRCGETKEVSQVVKVSSDKDNPAKVRVNYTIQDIFQR